MASPLQSHDSELVDVSSNIEDKSGTMDNLSLAFTIQFGNQKVDDSKKMKLHERLSSFTLKHRRNPSLPDIGAAKNLKATVPLEKLPGNQSQPNQVRLGVKGFPRAGYHSEGYFSSDQEDEAAKRKLTSLSKADDKNVASQNRASLGSAQLAQHGLVNGANTRRSSLSDIDTYEACPKANDTFTVKMEMDAKSDTVSEAGTYTVDKEEDEGQGEAEAEAESEECLNVSNEAEGFNPNHKWINDWVCKVAEQNFQYALEEPPISPSRRSPSSSPSASKIPSPISTLPNKFKANKPASKVNDIKPKQCEDKSFVSKLNGSLHRRSSSLSAKDYAENRTSDSSLETESFLRTTESVVTAMQNRMRMSLDGREWDTRRPRREQRDQRDPRGPVEKPHPPSTASDTDTNSDTDGRAKKPLPAPFASARLNRAFSLRRARAEPEVQEQRRGAPARAAPTPSPPVRARPPVTAPFSRTDCGRFSMRSTASAPKASTPSPAAGKKDTKKTPSSNGRSNSSLSSREMDFQNWKRRKNFDPMKAAAEGRKKEQAKKAALNQTMTQSVNLGTTIRTRNGNPVLRSASFHSTPHQGPGPLEPDDDGLSAEEYEDSPTSSWVSNQPALPPNSPTRQGPRPLLARGPTGSSRCSLNSVSETHSSPSHRVRSEVLDNLVMAAIHDLSYKLKLKSCNLLKKLNSLYDEEDDRCERLREEISALESRRDSTGTSPNHQVTSRDLSATLKNLKSMESVLSVLDEVLLDDNLQVCIDN